MPFRNLHSLALTNKTYLIDIAIMECLESGIHGLREIQEAIGAHSRQTVAARIGKLRRRKWVIQGDHSELNVLKTREVTRQGRSILAKMREALSN